MIRRDKHGRAITDGCHLACDGYHFAYKDGRLAHPPETYEVLALEWTTGAPEPPRVGGVPLCVGDEVEFRGMRSTVTADDLAGKTWLKDPFLRLLRFAGEDRDVGAEAGDDGPGDGWVSAGGDVYEHGSGAFAIGPGTDGNWRGFLANGHQVCVTETRREAERLAIEAAAQRLALNQPPRAEPRLVYADGQEVRVGSEFVEPNGQRHTVASVHCDRTGPHLFTGEDYAVTALGLCATAGVLARSRNVNSAPVPIARDTIPAAAPAIVAETEQARRVAHALDGLVSFHQQTTYGEFRAAIKQRCPKGCDVTTDRYWDVLRDTSRVVFLSREKRSAVSQWDREETAKAIRWIQTTVEQWDRDAGAAMREGGK